MHTLTRRAASAMSMPKVHGVNLNDNLEPLDARLKQISKAMSAALDELNARALAAVSDQEDEMVEIWGACILPSRLSPGFGLERRDLPAAYVKFCLEERS